MIPPSKCDHGGRFLRDPNHPLKPAAQGGGFVLRQGLLSSAQEPYRVTHCFFCGGRLDGADVVVAETGQICPCIKSHADDPSCPVKWDTELEEFNVLSHEKPGRALWRMYFCPWCGSRLPEGRRAERFTQMSSEDLKLIRTRLEGAESIADVIARLGEPDRVFPGHPDDFRMKYDGKKVLRQLDFLGLSPTVSVCVQEFEDTSIQIHYSGKFIGKSRPS